ncbi:MAG: hypothetical protein FJY92_03980, partial [Candidatus Hydrogenedentes bacterium]|nr:hypothetical protein [Candidatus Hydrogenedentota bacterium]
MRFDVESPVSLIALIAVPLALLALRYTLVDSPRAQLALSAAVRACVIALIVLALASALYGKRSTHVSVMVLADLSDSTPQTAPEQVKRLTDAIAPHATNP